jgi:integrase
MESSGLTASKTANKGPAKMITEMQIKSAAKRVLTSGERSIELKDDGERGAGRLAALIRPMKSRIAVEWYAVWYRDGKRKSTKIGSYPTMSLLDARKKFREEYAPAISMGAEPDAPGVRGRHRSKPGTISLKELFEAYVASLEAANKRSATSVRRVLLSEKHGAARKIGSERRAASIVPNDVVPYLSSIHARGAVGMARQARAYLSAAFTFGMKSANDYTRKDSGTNLGIKLNPVTAIPADLDAFRVGERFLSIDEFRTFWLWLADYQEASGKAPAVRLIMATGQRVEEILRINVTGYDEEKKLLSWEKTKNGLPHSIPLPEQAIEILDGLFANKHGLFFPHKLDPKKPSPYVSCSHCIAKFRAAHPSVPHFTPRDLRRTWKTLSGEAGIAKEWRDRLQNHAKSDVSSRHYDRYEYLAEKRAAMDQWSRFLARLLAGELGKGGVETKSMEADLAVV